MIVSGVVGEVVAVKEIFVVPVPVPTSANPSPVLTSEKKMSELLVILCMLISVPFLDRKAVSFPMPELKVMFNVADTVLGCKATKAIPLGAAFGEAFFAGVFFAGLFFFVGIIFFITTQN